MIDVEAYRRDGFALVRGVMGEDVLAPMVAAIARRVDELARAALEAGAIASLHRELDLEHRLLAVLGARALAPRAFDALITCPELEAIARHPPLLDHLAVLLGEDITYHGNSHVRAHPPGDPAIVPWHQDAQFYGRGSEQMREHMVQVWLPLVDVDAGNGCMALVPGSHRWGLLPVAIDGGDNVTRSTAAEQEAIYRHAGERARAAEVVTLPMRRGDALLFTNVTVHTGLPNRSSRVRWSVDLRFEATLGSRPVDEAARAGYDVYHRRLRGRGHPALRVRQPAGARA